MEEGQRVLQPLREFATPLADLSAPMPFVEVQKTFDEDYPAHIMRYYWKSLYLKSLNDDAIERIIEHNAQRPSSHSTIDIWQLGGAMNRVGLQQMAFTNRTAPFLLGLESNWEDAHHDEINIAWARQFLEAMREFSDGSQYLNFPGLNEDGEAQLRTTFGDNYPRLVELKNKYDPRNLFRLYSNIQPTV